ncbi:MAG: aspartate kinase, partial [Prevotellaceae bacterium]|nr:aspartate kinase [Prevotellaceae bacterium]
MIVMKFGGTSVGSPERIKSVVNLVNDNNPKIVVLSAMSGTTNALVKISELFYAECKDVIAEIDQLENKYGKVVDELYSTEEYKLKGKALIKERFDLLRGFEKVTFTPVAER